MRNSTFDEMNLLCIYNTGCCIRLIDALTEMCGEPSPEDRGVGAGEQCPL